MRTTAASVNRWPVTVSAPTPAGSAGLVRGLGLLAAAAIVIGDVIGTGVFLKARVMTCNVGTPGLVVTVWVVAGLLSLAGALTYAELAAMMPRAGGEYVFIRQAYGRLPSFLYGWTRFFVASTGGIAGLAAGFAIFINVLTGGALQAHGVTLNLFGYRSLVTGLQGMAIAAILLVTILNCTTVAVGGRIAFILTVFKIALVLGIGLGAMLLADGSWAHFALSNEGGACEGVAAAARGGAGGLRRGDARRDVGVQRLERGDLRRGRSERPSAESSAGAHWRHRRDRLRCTSSSTLPTSTS